MNVQGIDVSNFQHHRPPAVTADPDWPTVAAAGIRFAWVLVTDGLLKHDKMFVNKFFDDDIRQARENGIKVGGYHFGHPEQNDVDVEARWYRSHLPDELDLPTGLDMEQQFWLPSRAANTDWALRFFDLIDARIRLLYTNGDGIDNHLDSGRLVAEGVELWYAHPGSHDMGGKGAWTTASTVQYEVGTVDGIPGNVDRNVMPEEVLDRWTSSSPMGSTGHPQEDENVLHIIKGDVAPEWWLTDLVTKRYIQTPTDAGVIVFQTIRSGGRISHDGNNGPQVLPQASVDAIPVRVLME